MALGGEGQNISFWCEKARALWWEKRREEKKRRRREEKKRKRRRNPGLAHLLCLELDISSLEVWNFGLEIVWNSCLEISYVWFLYKLCRKISIRSVVGW